MQLTGQIQVQTAYQREYKQVDSRNVPGLGEVFVFEHPLTRNKVIAQQKEFRNKEELKEHYMLLINRQHNQHENQIKILDIGIAPQENWSSTVYKLFVFYEYFSSSLKEKLQFENQGLSQVAAIHLLYQGCKVLQDLYQKFPLEMILITSSQVY